MTKEMAKHYKLKFCPIYELMQKAPNIEFKNSVENKQKVAFDAICIFF